MNIKKKYLKWLWLYIILGLLMACLPYLVMCLSDWIINNPIISIQERNTILMVLIILSLYPLPLIGKGLGIIYPTKRIMIWSIDISAEAIGLAIGIIAFLYFNGTWNAPFAMYTAFYGTVYLVVLLMIFPLGIYSYWFICKNFITEEK